MSGFILNTITHKIYGYEIVYNLCSQISTFFYFD